MLFIAEAPQRALFYMARNLSQLLHYQELDAMIVMEGESEAVGELRHLSILSEEEQQQQQQRQQQQQQRLIDVKLAIFCFILSSETIATTTSRSDGGGLLGQSTASTSLATTAATAAFGRANLLSESRPNEVSLAFE